MVNHNPLLNISYSTTAGTTSLEMSLITTSIASTILMIGVILNFVAIFLLFSIKVSYTNQNIILLNLAASEILLGVTETIYWLLTEFEYSEDVRITQIIVIVNSGIYGVYYSVMIFLTVDRLIASLFTFSYQTALSPKRVRIVMAFCWVFGFTSFVPFLFTEFDYIYEIYYKILFLLFDGIFLLVAMLTYGRIYCKLLKRRKRFSGNSNNSSSTPSNGNTQFQMIVSLILLSFLVLVVLPDIAYVLIFVIYEIKHSLAEDIILIVWEMNFIIDPALYIYFQKSVKRQLRKSVLRPLTARRKRTSTMTSTERGTNTFSSEDFTVRNLNTRL